MSVMYKIFGLIALLSLPYLIISLVDKRDKKFIKENGTQVEGTITKIEKTLNKRMVEYTYEWPPTKDHSGHSGRAPAPESLTNGQKTLKVFVSPQNVKDSITEGTIEACENSVNTAAIIGIISVVAFFFFLIQAKGAGKDKQAPLEE